MLAAGPNFVQEVASRPLCGAVQIIREAALFPAARAHQRAQFRFQQQFLTFARAQDDYQGYSVLGQLYCGVAARFSRAVFSL